jgi:hypothetical protein
LRFEAIALEVDRFLKAWSIQYRVCFAVNELQQLIGAAAEVAQDYAEIESGALRKVMFFTRDSVRRPRASRGDIPDDERNSVIRNPWRPAGAALPIIEFQHV